MKRAFSALAISALALGAFATTACSTDDKTQVTVAIQSEAIVPSELSAFTVKVTSTRTHEVRFTQTYYPESKDLPSTLAVIPADEDSLGSPVEIEIAAFGAGTDPTTATPILKRSSVVSYIEGRNLLLSMPLRMACLTFQECGDGKTCAGGQCVSSTVPSSTLKDYSAGLVTSTTECFDEDKCLAQSLVADVKGDCTFALPSQDASTVNVSIRWKAAAGRLLTLDRDDPQEGWTVVSPGLGRLSDGICNSHFQRLGANGQPLVSDVAEQVYVATSCAAKTASLPYCPSGTHQSGTGAAVPQP